VADVDPEFALARIRLFQTEPVLRSRYLENLAEWEAAVAAMVARERGVDAGDFECWLGRVDDRGRLPRRVQAQLTGAETHFATIWNERSTPSRSASPARGLTTR